MATCALCYQEFAGEIEFETHLVTVHELNTQTLPWVRYLKRKSICNDDVDCEIIKG